LFFGSENEVQKSNPIETEAEMERVEVDQNPASQNSEYDEPFIKPHDYTKFGKNLVYNPRGKAIPGSTHVQVFNPLLLHEIKVSDPINLNSTNCDDLTSNELPFI